MLKANGSDFDEPVLGVAEEACIELLETVLADARRGNVSSLAIVACGPADFGASFAGPDAAKLNLGLDHCKALIMSKIMQPAPRGGHVLLRPGMRR